MSEIVNVIIGRHTNNHKFFDATRDPSARFAAPQKVADKNFIDSMKSRSHAAFKPFFFRSRPLSRPILQGRGVVTDWG
ncbi:hypothetical protein LJR129_004507 [Acidovorax sp. LjRoot129]|uniref:hypothetical protein n=1 Tax=Acidovorax sp. LjRoot129 TaxID=3342260 RepID=UPI003ECF2C8F